MAYYLESGFDSHSSAAVGGFNNGSAPHSTNLHSGSRLDYSHTSPYHSGHHHEGSMYSTHHSHLSGVSHSNAASPRTFPAFDPESPFNSPFVPVRSVGRDGRLKTKLMGIGTEGGYLTSPLINGKVPNGPASRHAIAIDSPVPNSSFIQDQGPLTNLAPRTSSLSQASMSRTTTQDVDTSSSSTSTTGMGIAISGLSSDLELGDYSNPATKIVAESAPRFRMSAYAAAIAEDDALEVAELIEASSPVKKSDPIKFPNSPPSAVRAAPPATGRRPKKNLSIKTLNKAKSCSALSPTAQAQQYGGEPLTPVSSHSNNFLIPGVPFNSPLDEALASANDPMVMPFSFADLYSYGLAVDSVDENDPRKSPYHFATDLLSADGTVGMGIGFDDHEDQDYEHSLPTPSFAHGSGFSSPSASSRSGPSPNLNEYNSPQHLSSAAMLQAPSMLSAPSMESAYSLPLPMPMSQGQAGRQRCSTYNHSLDPSMISPRHNAPGHSRQASASSAYGPQVKYSYPSRYQAQGPAPAMTWANSVPPSQAQTPHFGQQGRPYINNVDSSMFIPRFQENHHIETVEDLYERMSAASTGYSTPGKRGRGDLSDDEGAYDDQELTPRAVRQMPLGGSPSPHKKLRTVASAPCLPTRRMRPGPRPKHVKSPQEEHQSMFSAHLSPPPVPQLGRFARSETGADDDDADEQETASNGAAGTNGSLPKEVIQSLYEGVPAHIDASGAKVSKRYLCLMEGCARTFPRKSAIESHIQTHLEDKPFVCPHDDCGASFVRQHDLRRHERIHSGNKPFPCPCGKGFARGDALARHRARGICEGSLVPRRT